MNDEQLSMLVVRFGIYYGTVDEKLRVRFNSDGVFYYLGEKPVVQWMDLADFLPEVVGIENEILRSIDGEREEYSIQSVNRRVKDDVFFNIYFLRKYLGGRSCVVVIKDLTNELLYRQAVQQKKNEVELLQQRVDVDVLGGEFARRAHVGHDVDRD